jgi:hypothetical protein
VVQKDLLKLIQDYRFKHRYNSASDAIRALIGHGLVAEGMITPAEGVSVSPAMSGAVPVMRDGKLLGWSAELR